MSGHGIEDGAVRVTSPGASPEEPCLLGSVTSPTAGNSEGSGGVAQASGLNVSSGKAVSPWVALTVRGGREDGGGAGRANCSGLSLGSVILSKRAPAVRVGREEGGGGVGRVNCSFSVSGKEDLLRVPLTAGDGH